MPQIIVLPHVELCPEGAAIEAKTGESICQTLLDNEIDIDHVCDQACACTTCHVIIREGYDSLEPADELEDDLLDKAWGLEPNSRLSCQVILNDTDLVVLKGLQPGETVALENPIEAAKKAKKL